MKRFIYIMLIEVFIQFLNPCIFRAAGFKTTGSNDKDTIRPRVIIMSDFPPLDVIPGGTNEGPKEKLSDPDDIQSMVRFLLYTNDLEVEGLVAASGTMANIANKQNIIDVLDLYDKVDENLRKHDPRYPTADKLKSITWEGRSGAAWKPYQDILGEDKDSEASENIIKVIDKPDPRPVWFCVWGGPCELGQAIWKVKNTRTQDEFEHFLSKIRVYMIGLGENPAQDGAGQWMLDNFPNLLIIASQKTYHGIFAQNSPLGNIEWINSNIREGHGPLGAAYPKSGWNPKSLGQQEGDTPSYLHLVSAVKGINNPEKPDMEGWGGQYARPDSTKNHWFDGPGPQSISKWLPDIQTDFAKRTDWMLP